MDSLLEKAGDVLGFLGGGGRSEVTAAALTAKIGQKLNAVRDRFNERAKGIGEKLGPVLGSNIFESLAAGAAPAASQARADEAERLFGARIDPRMVAAQLPLIAAAVGIIAGGVVIWKALK